MKCLFAYSVYANPTYTAESTLESATLAPSIVFL